jgi:acetyl esterase/lipase
MTLRALFARRRILGATGIGAALLGAGCSPVEMLNVLAGKCRIERDIAYGPDPRHRLDVYVPASAGPHPALMFLYGGNWDSGSRAMYRFVGTAFAARGFLTVIPDYRLYPAVRFPVFLEDCARAFAWTRREADQYGGAGMPRLLGHSAGAYNAAMLALAPDYLGAFGLAPRRDIHSMVGLAGPYDFLPLHSAELRRVFGASGDGMAPAATQPVTFADIRSPPMLLMAGTADTVVDPGNTRRLAARLQAAGARVETRFYPGVGHREIIGAIAPVLRFLAPTLRDCVAFLADDGVAAG